LLENRAGGGDIFNGHDLFIKIISVSNLFTAWSEFKRDKIKKNDVSSFAVSLEEELFNLHHLLKSDQYKHDKYTAFYVHDPKLRSIHKAKVIDRVFHHALVRIIEPIFDKGFIFDSYSSRKNKGTYEAGKRFRKFAWKLSNKNTKTVWILKCDIKKFFDSVDHDILISLLLQKIKDEKVTKLLIQIIKSFQSQPGKGIPLGNLTSQLFSNKGSSFTLNILRVIFSSLV
jgi:retron-type reverse transcriptase